MAAKFDLQTPVADGELHVPPADWAFFAVLMSADPSADPDMLECTAYTVPLSGFPAKERCYLCPFTAVRRPPRVGLWHTDPTETSLSLPLYAVYRPTHLVGTPVSLTCIL